MEEKLTRTRLEQMMNDLLERSMKPVKQALEDAKMSPNDIQEVVLVGGSTRIPKVQQLVRNFFGGKEPHKGVNPDEVVAVGAAIQGAVLGGDAKDNRSLGTFKLDGIPPAPRGTPQIEVTFDIDANGILNVSAKDKATNKEQKITITASTGLTKEEAEKMRVEAESHAEEDRKRMEEVEARNRLDGIVYHVEKTIRDHRDKLNDADVKQAEEAIEEAKKAVNEGGVARLRSAAENVEKTLHKMAEELYKKAQAAGAEQAGAAGAGAGAAAGSASGGGGAQGGQKPGDVIDAEYVDVDDSKKPN